MLRHVVLLKFKEGCSAAQVQAVVDGMNALPGQVPQLLSFHHGKDAGLSGGEYDYGVVADFASEADYAAYLAHPAHRAVGAAIIAIMAGVAQMQFYCDQGRRNAG